MSKYRKLTQEELVTEARERFGDNPLNWAFQCPSCGDVAAARDFPEGKRNMVGQECVGRHRGALSGGPTQDRGRSRAERGCDWAAYGLFPGPWQVVIPGGDGPDRVVPIFPLAPAPAKEVLADV